MIPKIVITIDGNVDRPNADPSMHEAYLPKLRSMKHGDSFFVPDLLSTELAGLIAFARDLGIHLNAVSVDSDVIYRTHGTRVWRVAESEFQQLSDAAIHYYLHTRSGLTYKVRSDIPPSKDPNVVRIGEADYLQRPDYTGKYFNWMDEDGTTWWKNSNGDPIAKPEGIMLEGQHQRIDKANYEALLYAVGKLAGQDGSVATTPATPAPDVTEVQEQTLETYWRKADGSVVAVPAAKFQAAVKTKGAVEVDREAYDAWIAATAQDDDDDL